MVYKTTACLGGLAMAQYRGLQARAGTRWAVLGAAVAAGAMLLSATSAAAQGCTREDLQDTVDDYIDAQQAADPIKMHMNLWVDYNEQMQNATMSTGIMSKGLKIDFH